jgi:GNAT superfamily N-acetyltransferase
MLRPGKVDTMTVSVTELAPSDEAGVIAFCRLEAEAMAHDVPDMPVLSLRAALLRLRHGWPGTVSHRFLAVDADGVCGVLGVDLPLRENLQLAELEVLVHPERRRRGTGRALYEAGVAFARAHDRTVVQAGSMTSVAGGPDRGPAPAAFAAAVGAKAGLVEVRRRLDLDTVDRTGWGEAWTVARTKAEGYSLMRWTYITPAGLVDEVAALDSLLLLDSPTGDLLIEAERIDAGQVRATEETIRLRGRRPYHVGAIHDATGQLAAWTTITYDLDNIEHAWQQITIVDPAHRGRRLGLLVKVENLRHALEYEPGTRHIDTFNAVENDHMIAINEALGFRSLDCLTIWQAAI